MLTVTKVTLEKGKKTLLKELSFSLKWWPNTASYGP